MNGNDFELVEKVKDFVTFYFLESHSKSLNNNVEVFVDSPPKYFKPIRKLIEKEFKDNQNQEFIVTSYAINFKPESIKKKEIKDINGVQSIPLKLILKIKKDKYESHTFININSDSFNPHINFEPIKKIFKKDIPPPEQYNLTNIQIMQVFNDSLIIKERLRINDLAFIELSKFGFNLISQMANYELNLFLMLYTNILNGNKLDLIAGIFDIFHLGKIIKALDINSLSIYQEKLEILYNEQNKVFEKVKRIPNSNFRSYLIKFYTIYINYYFTLGDFQKCEKIMMGLKDNNPYDNLILARLYLSEFSQFYRNIPINNELKNILMDKFIYTSENYNNLLTSFSIISEYLKKDLVSMLLVVIDNYDKINTICQSKNLPININEFLEQNYNDDLSKVENYLNIITQNKIKNNFKAINFNINMWDFYLLNGENINFLEFLKKNLIEDALCFDEINKNLLYLIKYTNKDFIQMLEIIVNNYEKLKFICQGESKQIIISEYIEQKINDNPEKIKEYLTFIISQKIKDQYELVYFNINIWIYYIFNHFENEFLTFLEVKLYEGAFNSNNIFDCINYSSNFRIRKFTSMLEIILYNFDKIQYILKNELKYIDIQNYITQQVQTDDLSKIYGLIKSIIEKEINNAYCSVKFNVNIWLPYAEGDNFDTLRFIRKIIFECKIMEPDVDESGIHLDKRIHELGLKYIQRGMLEGEKLLQFLGEDEVFYVNKQINKCIQKNKDLENQINSQGIEINNLKNENKNLKNNIKQIDIRVNNLSQEIVKIKSKYDYLENKNLELNAKIVYVKSDLEKLEKKVKEINPSQG